MRKPDEFTESRDVWHLNRSADLVQLPGAEFRIEIKIEDIRGHYKGRGLLVPVTAERASEILELLDTVYDKSFYAASDPAYGYPAGEYIFAVKSFEIRPTSRGSQRLIARLAIIQGPGECTDSEGQTFLSSYLLDAGPASQFLRRFLAALGCDAELDGHEMPQSEFWSTFYKKVLEPLVGRRLSACIAHRDRFMTLLDERPVSGSPYR